MGRRFRFADALSLPMLKCKNKPTLSADLLKFIEEG
jgi:hypothetical protein